MIIKTTTQSRGVSPTEHVANVKKSLDKFYEEFNKTGEAVQAYVKDYIAAHQVRPQVYGKPNLIDGMEFEVFQTLDGFGWGIGPIDKLDEHFPYWRAVNYGSSHMVGRVVTPGLFSDNDGCPDASHFREGRWRPGAGNKAFRVKNPIPAMNYIENTRNMMVVALQQLMGIIK